MALANFIRQIFIVQLVVNVIMKMVKSVIIINVLATVLVHPDQKQVLPLFPEVITYQDGTTKNDCEANASKRLLKELRKTLPDWPLLKQLIDPPKISLNTETENCRRRGLQP
jgi:hypothetical protein